MNNDILKLVRKNLKKPKFEIGKDVVKYAGRVYDEKELYNLIDASLKFYLTEGEYCEELESKITHYIKSFNTVLTNSGSSANLLAITSLASRTLGHNRLKKGEEVITLAAGFPTTVAPIVQNGLVPVFVDVDLGTYNVNIDMLKDSITEKTRCVFLPHTLGNPFNIKEVLKLCKEYDLWFIEDNCDALGSKYDDRYTGTFGHLATLSFYPAHHITTGEGGAVIINKGDWNVVKSLRDWGRDCKCGYKYRMCNNRFTGNRGDMPEGYDHRYIYSELGYNLKMTDLQASIGCAQMDKLDSFIAARKQNFIKMNNIFEKYKDYFILPVATDNSDPAWFAYPLTVKGKIGRNEITKYLNDNKIETRNMFAGNITKQECMKHVEYRIADNLINTDIVMTDTFFIGVYPGLTDDMFKYLKYVIDNFMKEHI